MNMWATGPDLVKDVEVPKKHLKSSAVGPESLINHFGRTKANKTNINTQQNQEKEKMPELFAVFLAYQIPLLDS